MATIKQMKLTAREMGLSDSTVRLYGNGKLSYKRTWSEAIAAASGIATSVHDLSGPACETPTVMSVGNLNLMLFNAAITGIQWSQVDAEPEAGQNLTAFIESPIPGGPIPALPEPEPEPEPEPKSDPEVESQAEFDSAPCESHQKMSPEIISAQDFADDIDPYQGLKTTLSPGNSECLDKSISVLASAPGSPSPENLPVKSNSSNSARRIITAETFSQNDSQASPSSVTSNLLGTGKTQILLPQAPPVNHFQSEEKGALLMTIATASRQSLTQLLPSDLHSPPSKTLKDYLVAPSEKETAEATSGFYLKTYTSWGTMRSGVVSLAGTLKRPSLESGYCWLPSPTALSSTGNSRPPGINICESELRKRGAIGPGECLNPATLERFFGIPINWSDPLELRAAAELTADAGLPWAIASILEWQRSRSSAFCTSEVAPNEKLTSHKTVNLASSVTPITSPPLTLREKTPESRDTKPETTASNKVSSAPLLTPMVSPPLNFGKEEPPTVVANKQPGTRPKKTTRPARKTTKGKKELILSMGWVSDRLHQKTVTRRCWKDSYASRFVKAMKSGRTVIAYDKAPYAKGKPIARLRLDSVYKERLGDMPPADAAKEGFPELTKPEFIDKFFDGNLAQTVWVIRFTIEEWLSNKQLELFPEISPPSAEPGEEGWNSDQWQTPPRVLSLVKEMFGGEIDLDPATDASNPTGANRFFTLTDDCLTQDCWEAKSCFLNPPYSKPLLFIEKLCHSLAAGLIGEAILLVRQGIGCNQGTGYWIGEYATGLCEWRAPRINFLCNGISSNRCNFDCNLYYFGKRPQRFQKVFSQVGTTWRR